MPQNQASALPGTEARSALNVMQATSVPPNTMWSALRSRAVKATKDSLQFADGSMLKRNAEAGAFIAL
jgi:hypothetical protein